ncbi:flagellin domain-containing protein [Acetobacter estunensis NRIC 0472]|uniref:Flagellin n=1 Tax=Acetobacter estunensis TaxID=104097 RepID=A0A967B745_9PROT|nr:flagellin [Acetobacter estunensis]NHO53985.1 hypothetical protein [Acetobacter estunensis]GBQ20665.1 flagellin domain-containing protein [Acetobacter estunensis NRIC 0472]
MSLSINTNAAAAVALENLNATTNDLTNTENTISTGQKVSNAADNPAVYAIGASMTGNINGLSAVSDSLSLGASTVATATSAVDRITSTLQTLQATVTQSGQTGIDANAMASQIMSALDSVNTYARNATFNGVNLLTSGSDATNAYNGTTLNTLTNLQGATQTFSTMSGSSTTLVDALGLTSDSSAGSTVEKSTQSIYANMTSANTAHIDTSALTSSDITFGTTTTDSSGTTTGSAGTLVTVGSKTFEFVTTGDNVSTDGNIAVSVDAGSSVKSAMSALVSAMNGAGVSATLNSDGSLSVGAGSGEISMTSGAAVNSATITRGSTGDESAVTLGDGSGTSAGDKVTVGGTTYEFVSSTATLTNGVTGTGNVGIKLATGATVKDALSALSTATNGAVSYNTSTGKLTSTSAITAGSIGGQSVKTTATDAGTTVSDFSTSAGSAIDQLAIGLKSGVSTAVTALQSAITTISSKAQTLGNYSNQITGLQTYTSNLSDALTNGVGALTDADMAAESAKLTSLQTKQQLAISTLSIAKSSSQNILSLFR